MVFLWETHGARDYRDRASPNRRIFQALLYSSSREMLARAAEQSTGG